MVPGVESITVPLPSKLARGVLPIILAKSFSEAALPLPFPLNTRKSQGYFGGANG